MSSDNNVESQIREALQRQARTEAAEMAIRAYGTEVYKYLHLLLRNADSADDVFSETCEKLLKSLATFRGECAMRTWCYKIAYHSAKNYERDAFRRHARPFTTTELSRVAAQVSSASRRLVRRERVERLRRLLDADEQTLLTLRLDRGLSYPEIALVMGGEGTPPDPRTLRKRFERLTAKLRQHAQEQGLLDE